MNTELLKEYIDDSNEYISNAATTVRDLATAVSDGEMSQSEYDELVGDVLDIVKIADAADDVATAAKIETAIRAIATIAPKLIGVVKG